LNYVSIMMIIPETVPAIVIENALYDLKLI